MYFSRCRWEELWLKNESSESYSNSHQINEIKVYFTSCVKPLIFRHQQNGLFHITNLQFIISS